MRKSKLDQEIAVEEVILKEAEQHIGDERFDDAISTLERIIKHKL